MLHDDEISWILTRLYCGQDELVRTEIAAQPNDVQAIVELAMLMFAYLTKDVSR